MARIELRDCTVRIKDGLGAHPDIYPCAAIGNKALTPGKTAVAEGDTTCKVSSVSIPTAVGGNTKKIPVALASPSTVRRSRHGPRRHRRTQGTSGTNAKQSVDLDATGPVRRPAAISPSPGAARRPATSPSTTMPRHVKAALVAMDDGYTAGDWDVTGVAGAWVVEFKGALGRSAPCPSWSATARA